VFVYLVHHGDALGPEVDPQRPLSPTGRSSVERLAQRAAARGVKPAAVWHSGKLRARQTADAFWRACNPLAELAAVRGLQPDDAPDWIVDRLASEARDLMVVGHMPHLDRVLNRLVARAPDAHRPFPLHGIVALESTEAGWVERWEEG